MELLYIFEWLTIIFLIIFCSLYLFYVIRFSYWKRQNIDNIKDPKFFFGNVKDIITIKSSYEIQLSEWYKQYKGYKMIGAYNLFKPILLVLDPELLNNILIKDFDHFQDHYSVCNEKVDPLSENLFFLSTEKWKELRAKITPIFSSMKLRSMFETILKCSEELDNCLNQYVDNSEPVDIKKIITKYLTNIIGSCFFGIDIDCFHNPNNSFSKNILMHIIPSPLDRFRLFLNHFFPNLCRVLHIRQINKETDEFFRNVIYDTAKFRKQNNFKRQDFLQLMLDLKINSDDKSDDRSNLNKIAAQTFIFFLGGFETTSSVTSFCLYELAKNPSVQERARQEVMSVLKNYENRITYDSIKDMNYLERVVLETARKHPSLGYLTRRVTKDYRIPNSNIVLKKGLCIFIPLLGIHYDPEYYPDPEIFNPDRFTFKNRATRPEVTNLSFGAGQRICIGMRFALLQVKVGLCRLLCNYRFTINSKTVEPLVLDKSALIRNVTGGIWLNVERCN